MEIMDINNCFSQLIKLNTNKSEDIFKYFFKEYIKSFPEINNKFISETKKGFDYKNWCKQIAELFKGKDRNNTLKAFLYMTIPYLEPERYYHSISHPEKLLRIFDKIKNNFSLSQDSEKIIKLAIILHDIVYKIGNYENEYYSSLKAKNILLELKIHSEIINAVDLCILKTWYSNKQYTPANILEHIVCDLDLSGFSETWENYSLQNKEVVKEYSLPEMANQINNKTLKETYALFDTSFLIKRRDFLESLFAKRYIYETEYFIENFNHIAKANIQKDIITINSIIGS